jgi:hypothetical protein
MMDNPAEHLKVIRQNLSEAVDGLSVQDLTYVPSGFNNHILWNAAHMLVTQQILIYQLSGLKPLINDEFIQRYRKGTVPQKGQDDRRDLEYVKEQMQTTADQMLCDFDQGVFAEYSPYQTSFGVKLTTATEAAVFNNIHESMHLGYVLAMKHVI